MDAGIRVGDWVIYQDSAGHLQVAPANVVNLPQMPFTVDKGFKMGQFAWYQVDDDLKMSEDDSGLSQRPFIVDGGVRVGEWMIHVNTDAVIEVALASTVSSVLSGVASSTQSAGAGDVNKIVGGEGFATGYASTEWQTAADSATGNPRIIINVNYTTLDSDWKDALDNWSVGDALVLKTPTQYANTVLTTTGGISSTVNGDYKQYFFDVDSAHSNSVYVYKVEHTPSESTPSYTYSIAITNSSGQAVTSVVEGATYTLTATTDAPDGSTVWFTAQEDIESGYSDPVTIDWLMDGTQSVARTGTVTNGVATTQLSIVADQTTETGYEKFRFVVSSDDDGVQWTGDGAGTTPWITIVDSSQTPTAPDLTQYNWEFTVPTADTGNNTTYVNTSNPGQLVEGVEYPFVINTNAPDGTQVFLWWSGSWVGTYDYDADPSPYSDMSYQKPSYGWHTVSNGQVTGVIKPYDDGVAENGEMVRFNIKDVSGWSNYNTLARSEWFLIADPGTSFVPPQSGQQVITGWHPQHSEDAISFLNWTIDVGPGEDVRFHLTIDETVDTVGRQEASFAFGQIEVGDVLTFWIVDHNGSYASTDVTITEVGTHYDQGTEHARYVFRTGSQWAGSEFNPSEPGVNNGYYWNVSPQHIFITIN